MITFIFLLMTIMLGALTVAIDMYLFKYTLWEALQYLFYSQSFIDRLILCIAYVMGLIWTIVADFRRKKKVKDRKYAPR